METSSICTAKQDRRFGAFLFAGAFIFYAFLMWCTPYSSDDLEFANLGFATVGEYVRFALGYGNGRFLGNLCAFLFCNSKLICVVGKAFVLASAVVLIPVVLGLQGKSNALMAFLLVTGMAPPVFGEAIIWTSGFGNYVPPIWLSLLIILLIQRYPDTKAPLKVLTWIVVPVMGVASQLFIEHSSGVNGLLAFCFMVYYFRKGEKSKAALSGLWLLSTAVGLGLMFLIPKIFYRDGNRVETYRSFHLDSIVTIVVSCVTTGIRILNYYFGPCGISLCFGAAATVLKTRQKRSEKANRILLGLVIAPATYMVCAMLMSTDRYLGKSAVVQHAIAAILVLILFGVWIFAALKLEREQRKMQLFLLGFALVSMVPLLVVSPTPPRIVLQSYVFVMLAALQCFDWSGIGKRKHCWKILLTVSLCLSVMLCSVFFSIRNMEAARHAHIGEQISNGAEEIEIFILPYPYTTWDHLWSLAYPFGKGEDILFDEIDFNSWMSKYY